MPVTDFAHSRSDRDLGNSLSLPPEEREACLRTACAGNPELLASARSYVEREQRMQGFLLDPLIRQVPSASCEVAQGGMGVVYEALDEKLDRRIAIKYAEPGFRKRLFPEIRNASEISYRNVCKRFSIIPRRWDGEEFDFLSMDSWKAKP